MATTIDAAFNQLLARLSTTPAETAAAKGHRASIETKLREAYGLDGFFRTGSFGNGTNISGFSDVDYFAVFRPIVPRLNSTQLLFSVAAKLRSRFPNTGVRVDTPAVFLPFGFDASEATEVTPAFEVGRTRLGFREFIMPDRAGGWMTAAPDTHNEYVRAIDDPLLGCAKALIRLLKGWKYFRNVPISSFYLELIAAEYAATQQAIVYDIDLRNVFEKILATGLGTYPDPRMQQEILRPCKTELQRADALSKLRGATAWSKQAVDLHYSDKIPAAFQRWNLVFNGNFPAFR